jgi:hypothetical protein
VTVTQFSTEPITSQWINGLALWFGPDGGTIVKTNSTWTSERIWYSNNENYQRMSDGTWRGMQEITFTTDLTINGGQEYDYFLDGSIAYSGLWHSPSLLATYQPNSGITPIGGSLDNVYYWYVVGTGFISTASPNLPLNHVGDANVAYLRQRGAPAFCPAAAGVGPSRVGGVQNKV